VKKSRRYNYVSLQSTRCQLDNRQKNFHYCFIFLISLHYPHMPIGKVWIYRLLFVILCVFVPLRISPPRIKLAASNFARRFINVQGRESHIFGNFVSPEVQNRTNWPARRPRPPACKHYRSEMRRRKRHARDAPFVKSRIMCGYTSVPKDRRNCLHESLLEVLNVLKT